MADNAPATKDEFTSIMMMLFQNPPDPNQRIPVWNRKGTIYGITIPLQVPFTPPHDETPTTELNIDRSSAGFSSQAVFTHVCAWSASLVSMISSSYWPRSSISLRLSDSY